MSEQKVEKIPGNAGISPDGFFAVQLSLVEKYAQYLSRLPKEDYAKNIYEMTKEFLSKNKVILKPQEKLKILGIYLTEWKTARLTMDPYKTEYAQLYKKLELSVYFQDTPMCAGFDLEGIQMNAHLPQMTFVGVNFKNADFSNAQLFESRFSSCDFSGVFTGKETNLCQCEFVNCNLNEADFKMGGFDQTNFWGCSTTNLQYPQRPYLTRFWDCEAEGSIYSKGL